MLNKLLGLFDEVERPSPGLQIQGKEVHPLHVSLGSPIFSGMWGMQCFVKENDMTPAGVSTGLHEGKEVSAQ